MEATSSLQMSDRPSHMSLSLMTPSGSQCMVSLYYKHVKKVEGFVELCHSCLHAHFSLMVVTMRYRLAVENTLAAKEVLCV